MSKLTWYAFRVRPQEERKIAKRLRWIGFNALVPVFRHWRKRNKYTQTKTARERPIMPGYVWIGMSEPIPWWQLLGREDIFSVVFRREMT